MGVFKVFKQKTLFILTLITMLFFFNKGLGILPQIPSGSSGYYVIPFGTAYITAIFNNTKVCADANENLVCDSSEITTLNAGQYMSTTARIIFTDKPVIATLRLRYSAPAGYPDYCSIVRLPSSSEAKTYYRVFQEQRVYIVGLDYFTLVNISYPNGTLQNTYVLQLPGQYVSLSSPATGTIIQSHKPVIILHEYLYTGGNPYQKAYAFIPRAGKEFYASPLASNAYIITNSSGTKILLDNNRDGIVDATYILDVGNILTITNLRAGAKLVSNESIYVASKVVGTYLAYSYGWLPTSYIGSEYLIPYEGYCGGTRYVYITPIQYKTQINITDVNGNLIATYNTLTPSDYVTLTNPAPGTKIFSDKPVTATLYQYRGESFYTAAATCITPLSPSTIIQTPGLIGVDEYGTIKVRFFNPTSETLYNISLEIYTHKNFTLVGGAGIVNVTIYKKDANSDAILSQDFVQKSYSLTGEDNVFTVSYQDSSLLSVLQPNEYIEVVYKVISNHAGYYSFRANSHWKATHWY